MCLNKTVIINGTVWSQIISFMLLLGFEIKTKLILEGGKLTVLHDTNKEGTFIKLRIRLNWKYDHFSWAVNIYGFI